MISEKQIVFEDDKCMYWVREDAKHYVILRNQATGAVEIGRREKTPANLEKCIVTCKRLKNWVP